MIRGTGVDIVEVQRLESSIQRYGQRFLDRLFTRREQEYCSSKANQYEHYAVRFAGKEAFLKAVGTGLRDGITWHDMEFLNDELGKPIAHYRGQLAVLMEQMGIQYVHVSFSHTRNSAVAMVIVESDS